MGTARRGRGVAATAAFGAALLAMTGAATAAPGEWTGTIRERQVIEQADGRLTETYTSNWDIGPTAASLSFSLTAVTKDPSMECGTLTGTKESSGSGAGLFNAQLGDDPASPTGASLSITGTPDGPYELRSTGQACVQYLPGLWRIDTSSFTGPYFPYPINDHPRCPNAFVPPNAQAVDVGITCEVPERKATLTIRLRRVACDPTVDSDGGGLADCTEYDLGGNPAVPGDDAKATTDTDGDGVPDLLEADAGSDPPRADSDGDGISDAVETNNGQHVDTDGDGIVDALDLDSDNDGIPDAQEGNGDSDGDALPDRLDAGGALTLEQAVVYYAPEVHLYPNDPSAPMDPGVFIQRSRLRWAVPRCPDLTVTSPPSAARLGRGQYRQRAIAHDVSCRAPGDRSYTTSMLTAASYDAKVSPPGQGFYLDLNDRSRRGVTPRDATYSNAPPLYYSARRGRFIVYWFFYAHNPRAFDTHEGDWERMVVRLGRDNRATHAAYFQHFCDPRKAKYGLFTWAEMESSGFLAAGSHPRVFSAKGGHPSYPANYGTVKLPCGKDGFLDTLADGGPIWQTWSKPGNLRNAAAQPWYGYGGAWGSDPAPGSQPGAPNAFGKGPLGPHPLVDPTGKLRW
jgi:hypothetical protein